MDLPWYNMKHSGMARGQFSILIQKNIYTIYTFLNNEATGFTQSEAIWAFLSLSSSQHQFFFDGKRDFAPLNCSLHFLSHSL